MMLFERLFPYTKNQKVFREGFFNDVVMYTIIQSYVLGLIIFWFLGFIKNNTDLYQYSVIGGIPVWAQVVFFVVTHDFYIYWFHRWQHSNKYLWRLHEAHHSPRTVDWLSGARSHSLEIFINQTIEFAPIILLGASPEVAVYKGMISAIWGMFIHANIDVRLGPLQYFINGPEMHRWHHSDDEGKEYQNNYSTKLAVWDWIFGTAFFPNPDLKKPKQYGLRDTPGYPITLQAEDKTFLNSLPKYKLIPTVIYFDIANYIRQHLYAFRRFEEFNEYLNKKQNVN